MLRYWPWVAAGAAGGTLARWGLLTLTSAAGLSTGAGLVAVNVLGAALLAWGWRLREQRLPGWGFALWGPGFCASFTTVSLLSWHQAWTLAGGGWAEVAAVGLSHLVLSGAVVALIHRPPPQEARS